MYKSVQELEQEALARMEKIYLEAETIRLLRQHRALPRQRIAAWLRNLADRLDLSTTSHTQVVTKVKQ
jgi:hypothetical protein